MSFYCLYAYDGVWKDRKKKIVQASKLEDYWKYKSDPLGHCYLALPASVKFPSLKSGSAEIRFHHSLAVEGPVRLIKYNDGLDLDLRRELFPREEISMHVLLEASCGSRLSSKHCGVSEFYRPDDKDSSKLLIARRDVSLHTASDDALWVSVGYTIRRVDRNYDLDKLLKNCNLTKGLFSGYKEWTARSRLTSLESGQRQVCKYREEPFFIDTYFKSKFAPPGHFEDPLRSSSLLDGSDRFYANASETEFFTVNLDRRESKAILRCVFFIKGCAVCLWLVSFFFKR